MNDSKWTHIGAGPCPRCGQNTVSYDDRTGEAECQYKRVYPRLRPDAGLPGKDVVPCGWKGTVAKTPKPSFQGDS